MSIPYFSPAFLDEIETLARKIAQRMRGEGHLQSPAALAEKFNAEMVELAETTEPWGELPDIGYYAACLHIVWFDLDGYQIYEKAMRQLDQEMVERNITMSQLQAAILAKYNLRAIQPKNLPMELAAIKAAVERVS